MFPDELEVPNDMSDIPAEVSDEMEEEVEYEAGDSVDLTPKQEKAAKEIALLEGQRNKLVTQMQKIAKKAGISFCADYGASNQYIPTNKGCPSVDGEWVTPDYGAGWQTSYC